MAKPPGFSMFLDLRNRRDNEEKNARIASLRLSPQEGLAVLTRDADKYRKEMREFAAKFMGPPGGVLFGCGAGHGMCIDAYGRAQPCMGVRAPELTYDVAGANDHSPLREALDQFSGLHDLQAANLDYLRRCAVCFLKGLCEQCPAKSWVEHGTLDTPVEYLCRVAHAQARWLGWLKEDEWAWTVTKWEERIRPGSKKKIEKKP
jgi:radical SAM protein with 4Fe4S-binding SPASM domain